MRRALAAPWPSLPQRLAFALIAWLPIAALIMLAGIASPACNAVGFDCAQPIDEVIQSVLLALSLGALFLFPRVAYVATIATMGPLLVGAVLAGVLYVGGVRLPLESGVIAAIGGALALGYVATAGVVALGPSSLRPWTNRRAQTASSR
jgi:hypothetical protein